DEQFRVDQGSFALFVREPANGFFMDRLYFVTRWGMLAGGSTAALSRIRHRAATDPRFDLDDPEYLVGLLRWCRSLPDVVEAPDVLRT
ncbi:MAG: hypothetical protein KY464_06200, partial [Gemmatimonadetes bacterium]|nr:hypothetical protein [Gemmatimonadota bacterium]